MAIHESKIHLAVADIM